MQNYMLSLLKNNLDNKQIQLRLMHDIEAVELAKKKLQQAFRQLMLLKIYALILSSSSL